MSRPFARGSRLAQTVGSSGLSSSWVCDVLPMQRNVTLNRFGKSSIGERPMTRPTYDLVHRAGLAW
ncbi:hypothetical protein SAMN05216289_1199 [Dokdonella immobilis]|uniref:Uncharacterized protein n=1 Tax=Dokdonella immobilis TaxID=578942 RepID=A0A1I4YPY1_9GAMM|nr:hypothetical protein SAMN05216289_1199 [Dokdonella immobilis]